MKGIFYAVLFSSSIMLAAQKRLESRAFPDLNNDYEARIDSLIKIVFPRSFSGVIHITKNGRTMYSKTQGYSDVENMRPITIKDNFRIQSNTKQITAVLILREVEKGKIDLRVPISRYLPEMEQSWIDSISVHQLLNFSAGITQANKPLAFRPGTGFLYNVANYTLLGKILERVTGKTYVEAANELFKELKMNNTFCYAGISKGKTIPGYVNFNGSLNRVDIGMTEREMLDFLPAGGVISNVKDLNTWDIKLHSGKVLSPKTYQQMTTYDILAQHDAFGLEKIGYGYGLRISDKTKVKHLGHAGKGLGFTSIKVYFPESGVNLIVLENQSTEDNSICYYFENKLREIVMASSLVGTER